MVTEVKPGLNNPIENPCRCDKCGGLIFDDYKEKRLVCLNCGAQKYYGIPEAPAQNEYQLWPLIALEPRKKYKPVGRGVAIALGHSLTHFEDRGCKEARRCQDCPWPVCVNPNV